MVGQHVRDPLSVRLLVSDALHSREKFDEATVRTVAPPVRGFKLVQRGLDEYMAGAGGSATFQMSYARV